MKSLSCVQPSATPWTAAYQAPPSMGFSRQEYWSGVPVPPPVISNPGPYPSYTLRRTHAHSLQSRLPLCSVWTVAQQASVPMGFSRQEYWSRQPFYPPGDLPNLGIEPLSPVATALAGRIFLPFTNREAHTLWYLLTVSFRFLNWTSFSFIFTAYFNVKMTQ